MAIQKIIHPDNRLRNNLLNYSYITALHMSEYAECYKEYVPENQFLNCILLRV